MNHLIELARSEAARDMEKKVNKVGTIGAGLLAAGVLGKGLYNMRKGKMYGAFKPKVDKKMSEGLAQADKTRKAMQARNVNFENMNMNHLTLMARANMEFAELRKYNQYDNKKVKRYRDLTDKEKNEVVPGKPFSRGTGAAAALAVGGIGGYQLAKRNMYNRRLLRVNQRSAAQGIKDFDKRNAKLGKELSKMNKKADKLLPKARAEKKGFQSLLRMLKKK